MFAQHAGGHAHKGWRHKRRGRRLRRCRYLAQLAVDAVATNSHGQRHSANASGALRARTRSAGAAAVCANRWIRRSNACPAPKVCANVSRRRTSRERRSHDAQSRAPRAASILRRVAPVLACRRPFKGRPAFQWSGVKMPVGKPGRASTDLGLDTSTTQDKLALSVVRRTALDPQTTNRGERTRLRPRSGGKQ